MFSEHAPRGGRTIDGSDRQEPNETDYREAIQTASAVVEELQALIQFGDRSGEPLPATVRVAQRSIARWVARLQFRLDAARPPGDAAGQAGDPPGSPG